MKIKEKIVEVDFPLLTFDDFIYLLLFNDDSNSSHTITNLYKNTLIQKELKKLGDIIYFKNDHFFYEFLNYNHQYNLYFSNISGNSNKTQEFLIYECSENLWTKHGVIFNSEEYSHNKCLKMFKIKYYFENEIKSILYDIFKKDLESTKEYTKEFLQLEFERVNTLLKSEFSYVYI